MKQGRNKKCECGSGLKYKNCCSIKKNFHTPKYVANEETYKFIKNMLETGKMWQSDGGMLRIYKERKEVEVLQVADNDMMETNLQVIDLLGYKIFVRDEVTGDKKYIPSKSDKIMETADDGNTIICSVLVAKKGSVERMTMKKTLLDTINTDVPFVFAVTESLMNEVVLPKNVTVEDTGTQTDFYEKVYYIQNNFEKLEK